MVSEEDFQQPHAVPDPPPEGLASAVAPEVCHGEKEAGTDRGIRMKHGSYAAHLAGNWAVLGIAFL